MIIVRTNNQRFRDDQIPDGGKDSIPQFLNLELCQT